METRELLSANVPGFSLSNGDLYNTALSSSQPIDTGVQNFTVVSNKVFDWHTDDTLHSLNADGTANAPLDQGVWKFVVDPKGNAYTLDVSDNLDINGVLGWGGSNPTRDFALGADGTLYKLNGSGSLDHLLTSGVWQHLNDDVTKFAVAGNTAYALDGNGNLYVNGALGWGGSNPTRDFALGADGTLYKLNGSGSLDHLTVAGNWQHLADDVAKFEVGGNTCYALTQDGVMHVNAVANPGWGTTKDFAVGADGSLYKLSAAGSLDHLTVAGNWQPVAGNVSSLGRGNDGNAYYLQNGTVYNATLVAAGQSGVVEQNVVALAQGPAGQVFMDMNQPGADSDKGLYLYNPATSSYSGYGIVQGLAEGNDGNAYYLQNGSLYNATTGAVVNVASVLQGQQQPSVEALAQGAGGQLYVVLQWLTNPITHATAESLYLYNPATGLANNLGQIQSFTIGGDGKAYYLQNGALYHDGLTAPLLSNVVSYGITGDGILTVLTNTGDVFQTPAAVPPVHL